MINRDIKLYVQLLSRLDFLDTVVSMCNNHFSNQRARLHLDNVNVGVKETVKTVRQALFFVLGQGVGSNGTGNALLPAHVGEVVDRYGQYFVP